ncbi:putative transcription factor WD40-like family [Rosa chinensis]|uniref:Peroxin-7 n=1 Tax=Rosa chinensis TaxID=74649 RepID=A0A2P6QX73_ROSCH|nr:putative transcription factor WD40-like family [Rosa chinensis]
MIIPAHEFEILSCDWNKYDNCVIVTASVDKSIKVWDARSIGASICFSTATATPSEKPNARRIGKA